MKKNLTELVFILDKSGSMAGLEDDTVGGFNAMLERQRAEAGEVLVSTVFFDQEAEVIHDRLPLEKIRPLTKKDYRVGGSTALVDALGGAIKHIGDVHRYIREEDIPEKTIFVITTDGMENASRRFSSDEVKKLVEAKKELGWEFLFLGANIDAVETAKHYGIDEDRASNYRSDRRGTRLNFKVVGDVVAEMRCANAAPVGSAWKKELEEDARRTDDADGVKKSEAGPKAQKRHLFGGRTGDRSK